jgi:hypothetical protein
MVSLTFAVFKGFIGFFAVGLIYVIFDQLISGYFLALAVGFQLSGDTLAFLNWLWKFIIVSITCSYGIGVIVKAHIERNQ